MHPTLFCLHKFRSFIFLSSLSIFFACIFFLNVVFHRFQFYSFNNSHSAFLPGRFYTLLWYQRRYTPWYHKSVSLAQTFFLSSVSKSLPGFLTSIPNPIWSKPNFPQVYPGCTHPLPFKKLVFILLFLCLNKWKCWDTSSMKPNIFIHFIYWCFLTRTIPKTSSY
jgi:hypothetical protein